MKGNTSARAAPVNVTSVNLASTGQKKVQTTNDIMRQIEASMPDSSDDKYKQEGISARILGRIDQHEAAYGDQHLPRSRLPRVDAGMLDRYQAARRNVLLLGALKAGSGVGSTTTRSNKAAATAHGEAATPAKAVDADAPAAGAGGLSSRCTSFSGATAQPACDVSSEASETLAAQCSQLSVGSGTRRIRHQCSSRSAASSCAGSAVSAGPGSSRQMQHQNSSASAASGHTLRSEATEDSRTRVGRSHKKTPRKKKPRPGRVAVALAEYSHKDDWMSKTLLRHYLASVIQARWRGYQLRKRWAQPENREQIVEEVKAKHAAEDIRQQRLRELQQKVVNHQQKQLAKAAAAAAQAAGADAVQGIGTEGSEAGGQAAPGGMQANSWRAGRLSEVPSQAGPQGNCMSQAVADNGQKLRYLQSLKLGYMRDKHQSEMESDSDSDWSDVEAEDIASIKFRAFTPPWQKAGERFYGSKQLRKRAAAAAAAATDKKVSSYDEATDGADLDSSGCSEQLSALWGDLSTESSSRLHELRHRRICRKPEQVALSEPAVAAAATSGLLNTTNTGSGPALSHLVNSGADPSDASAFPVPHQVVEQLLLDRYSKKYTRLGVPDMMPGRQRWLKQQRAAQEAAAASGCAASADTTGPHSVTSATGDTIVAEGAVVSPDASAAAVAAAVADGGQAAGLSA